jgi:hypothetical protein
MRWTWALARPLRTTGHVRAACTATLSDPPPKDVLMADDIVDEDRARLRPGFNGVTGPDR